MTKTFLQFPQDFIWGCATASYQIEGAFDEDGKGESIWDRFSHTAGKITNADTGDIACDYYHRFAEDIDLMAETGIKAYRFSISWPRVIPEGIGKINDKGLAFYDRLVDKLLEKQIIPFITLYHWDLPQILEDNGGWRNKNTSYAFFDYAKIVVRRLSDRVTNWMTLNEMPCSAFLGYKEGIHAPGAKEASKTINQVIHNLLLAHGLGAQAVREYSKGGSEVGLVHNPTVMIPKTDSKKNLLAARNAWYKLDAWYVSNAWWLDPVYKGQYPEDQWQGKGNNVPEITQEEMKIISTPIDFLGLNIYSGMWIEADNTPGSKGFREAPYPKDHPRTAMGWPIDPRCIYYGLKFIQERYNIPKFYISENGIAINDVVVKQMATDDFEAKEQVIDDGRIDYLQDHFVSAHKAIFEGINLAGYFVWSLMDNFEWSFGYSKCFGLVSIDYNTQKRILKKSVYWYKGVITRNAVNADSSERKD